MPGKAPMRLPRLVGAAALGVSPWVGGLKGNSPILASSFVHRCPQSALRPPCPGPRHRGRGPRLPRLGNGLMRGLRRRGVLHSTRLYASGRGLDGWGDSREVLNRHSSGEPGPVRNDTAAAGWPSNDRLSRAMDDDDDRNDEITALVTDVDVSGVAPELVCVRPSSRAPHGSDAEARAGRRGGHETEEHQVEPVMHSFVELFRGSAPYIRRHSGATVVVHVPGDVVEGPSFLGLMDDLGLLNLLGVHLVLVVGARPQISQLLQQAGIEEKFCSGVRITSPEALKACKSAAGFVRFEVESSLTRSSHNGRGINVAGGNLYSAQPIGVRGGVDFGSTGEVRRMEADKIRARLAEGSVVYLTCLGYSASGQVFNVDSRDLAVKCAAQLNSSKLIFVTDGVQLVDSSTGDVVRQLRLSEARAVLRNLRSRLPSDKNQAQQQQGEQQDQGHGQPGWEEDRLVGPTVARKEVTSSDPYSINHQVVQLLERAVRGLTRGVPRAHLLSATVDGALLLELYTRDGAGLMISRDIYDGIRTATVTDIPGILDIVSPLEEQGILVPRPRQQFEREIERSNFFVFTRDGTILAVAFLKKYGHKHAEIGCLAVHPSYRKGGRGEAMLTYLERVAVASGVSTVFVLSTRTMQWFTERGFVEADVSDLPRERRSQYDWGRMSKVYTKQLKSHRQIDAEEQLWNVDGMLG